MFIIADVVGTAFAITDVVLLFDGTSAATELVIVGFALLASGTVFEFETEA